MIYRPYVEIVLRDGEGVCGVEMVEGAARCLSASCYHIGYLRSFSQVCFLLSTSPRTSHFEISFSVLTVSSPYFTTLISELTIYKDCNDRYMDLFPLHDINNVHPPRFSPKSCIKTNSLGTTCYSGFRNSFAETSWFLD